MNSFPEVGFVVDIVPTILLLAIAFSTTSLLAALTSRIVTQHSLFWSLGGICIGSGLLLIVLRGQIPALASILVGNCLLILGQSLMSCGTSRYAGRRIVFDAVVGALFIVAFFVLYLSGGDLNQRVALIAVALITLCVRMVSGFIAAQGGFATLVAIAALSITAVLEVGRILVVFAQNWGWFGLQQMTRFTVGLGIPATLGIALAISAVNWPAFQRLLAKGRPSAKDAGPGIWQLASDNNILVTPDGQKLRLTGNEYLVLQRLGMSDEPIDRLTLNALIGRDNDNPKDRGIDILLSRLRRKCADAGVELPINSVRGRGYIFHGGLPEV